MNTAHVKAMAYEVCYGATGKVRTQFIALAKVNGYEGASGGWIYRTGSTDPIAQGWTALAGRVLSDAITLDASTLVPVAKPTAAQARFLTALADGHAAPQNVVGDWRPINACTSNGWAVAVPLEGGRVTWHITAEGRAVIGRTLAAVAAAIIEAETKPAETEAEPTEAELAKAAVEHARRLWAAGPTARAKPAGPRFPQGSPEYAAYKAELQIELDKFAKREAPYDYDELVATVKRLDGGEPIQARRVTKPAEVDTSPHYVNTETCGDTTPLDLSFQIRVF